VINGMPEQQNVLNGVLFARGQILLAGCFVLDRRSTASMAPPRGSAGFIRRDISLTLRVSALVGMNSRWTVSCLTRGHR
jgi:hypothetical protein